MVGVEGLAGLRLLLVEDEAMVAMMIEDMLGDFGCQIVGPAASVSAALELAGQAGLDGAILDVNVGGEPIYPVAEVLNARGVPFVFTTGYGAADIDGRFAAAPAVQKPFSVAALREALAQTVTRRA